MNRTVVYVSGPITGSDDPQKDINKACNVGRRLMEAGFSVVVPQLSRFMELVVGKTLPWQLWLDNDRPIVERCDVVLRLPGDSAGADLECQWAEAAGIPVYYSVDSLCDVYIGSKKVSA